MENLALGYKYCSFLQDMGYLGDLLGNMAFQCIASSLF